MRKLTFSILLCFSASGVWAIDIAPFSVSAGYTLQADSNIFRTPSNAQSDRVGITSLGLGFNTTQSLQKLELNASLVDYNYQDFDNLSHTAFNYDAAWRWSFTPRWTGILTSSRKETLNNDAQSINIDQRNQRNKRLDAELRLDSIYELDGPWRLVAGAARTKQQNELALVGGGDDNQTSGNAGVRYVYGSGSTMTYRATAANGNYRNLNSATGSYDQSGFHQFDHDLRLSWVFGGRDTLDANLTHLSRSYAIDGQRDFSGFAAGFGANWAFTGKTMLNAAYAHELSPYTTEYSNYAATDRISLGANWQMSPKVSLRLSHGWSGIDYRGDPGKGFSITRRDTTRGTGLSVAYLPTRQVTLNAGLQYLTRSSNLAYFDYDARIATLTAQFTY
jgi:exopolysaccharide biosynthesis operon protein EpsL